MAHPGPSHSDHGRAALAKRLHQVRIDLFGEEGIPEMARRLGIPAETWANYESGVVVPAHVLLTFIELTGVDPEWLLRGHGPQYRRGDDDGRPSRP